MNLFKYAHRYSSITLPILSATNLKAKFHIDSKDFWEEITNHRLYLDYVGSKLGVKNLDDWYDVKASDVLKHSGGTIFSKYLGGCVSKALAIAYPEHWWRPWRFVVVPRFFWNNHVNHRTFLFDFANSHNFSSWENWYHVTNDEIIHHGGHGLLQVNDGSIINTITSTFPEYPWKLWKFAHLPEGHWQSLQNQRKFMDDLAQEMNIKNYEQWYQVKLEDIKKHGGLSLLNYYYGSSLTKALSKIYPEHLWEPWRFSKVPRGYWDNSDNIQEFLKIFEKRLGIKTVEDWYCVTVSQLSESGAGHLTSKFGGVYDLLKKFYPNHHWEMERLERSSKERVASKGQRFLFKQLTELFPSLADELYMEFVSEEFTYEDSLKKMEFDFYFPSLKLAFEYQGQQHFKKDLDYLDAESIMVRDEEKRNLCKTKGITLVEIPYTWDGSQTQLITLIASSDRKDLFSLMNPKVIHNK